MKLQLRLLESDADISNQILIAIKDILNTAFNRSIKNLKVKIPQQVKNAIISEPEYQSLISGKLQYEFGIPDATTKVNKILDIWSNNINVNIIPVTISGNRLRGGFAINMIQSDYGDVLGDDSANVVDSKSGAVLPWLEWLLLYGNKIIINNYQVQVGPNKNSRTGLAIMVSSKESWRVPPEFAGSTDNNWITRALSKLDSTISNIIQQEIESNI